MSIVPYTRGGKRAYRAKVKFQNQQYTKSGFATKAEAKAWMVEEKKRLKAEAENKPQERRDVLMFSQASEEYLEDCSARMQPGSVSEKFHHYTKFVEWIGSDFSLEQITTVIAQDYAAHVLKTTRAPHDPKKTANRHIRNLKALWNWHKRRGYQGHNPFTGVESYPEDTVSRYVPPVEDVAKVLQVAEEWQRDFLHVLAKTGARPGEIRMLNWDDVELHQGTITLWTRKRKGGARQPRTINMSPQLLELMRRRFDERVSSEVVFPHPETGKPFTRQHRPYKFMMERLCEKAGVRFFTFYALRHFVATRLRDSGKANRYEIQHILGHTRSDTTDRYLRSLAPDVLEAVSVLDEVIDVDKMSERKRAWVIKFSRR